MNISKTAKDAVIKLPPDILMHPMPFPDRLDYGEKIIQEAINTETAEIARKLRAALARAEFSKSGGRQPSVIVQDLWSAVKRVVESIEAPK